MCNWFAQRAKGHFCFSRKRLPTDMEERSVDPNNPRQQTSHYFSIIEFEEGQRGWYSAVTILHVKATGTPTE